MAQVKEGWHNVHGIPVYVNDHGRIERGIKNGRTVYPYILTRGGGWDRMTSCTPDALRAGMKNGTKILS